MLEGICALVLLVVVAMMLGLIEVPGVKSTLQSVREPHEAKRARERASVAEFKAEEVSRLRRQFRSRLQ